MQQRNETFLTVPGIVVRPAGVGSAGVGAGPVRRIATAVLAMAALLSAAATSALALAPGDKVTNHIRLGSVQVPLPAGEWTVAGTGKQGLDVPAIGA